MFAINNVRHLFQRQRVILNRQRRVNGLDLVLPAQHRRWHVIANSGIQQSHLLRYFRNQMQNPFRYIKWWYIHILSAKLQKFPIPTNYRAIFLV